MKKLLLTLVSAIVFIFAYAETSTTTNVCKIDNSMHVRQINDSTILYRNVDKIQIITNSDATTKIFDARNHMIYCQPGSFVIQLEQGDYTVVSNKKFAAAQYKRHEIMAPCY